MQIFPAIHDQSILNAAAKHAREKGVVLPTFSELASPKTIAPEIISAVKKTPANKPDPGNLFRINWFNDNDGGLQQQPAWLEIPPSISGVRARIVVVLGDSFPMIEAHKVLAAYACLVTRLVTGRFDPQVNKAIWPSTGNYCRGGIAISRILECRGVAVLPEQMSRERFNWLENWTLRPDEDIIRTTGSESNVKEIYDACDELSRDPNSVVLNQFNEFANYLCHRSVTGPSMANLYQHVATRGETLHAFIAGTGSAGTIAAGDYLKQTFGTNIVATEPLECPTMQNNGYGEHHIQGIGDKHIPLIHNVMNMDYLIGISDSGPDFLNILFNTPSGKQYLQQRTAVSEQLVDSLTHIGISGLANIQSAIKLAKYSDLDENNILLCVATDGANLYKSELDDYEQVHFAGNTSLTDAAEIFGRCLAGCEPAYVNELSSQDKKRIFNLGYYTWVEQRGISVEHFNRRKKQSFWDDIADQLPEWDKLINHFNLESGATISN